MHIWLLQNALAQFKAKISQPLHGWKNEARVLQVSQVCILGWLWSCKRVDPWDRIPRWTDCAGLVRIVSWLMAAYLRLLSPADTTRRNRTVLVGCYTQGNEVAVAFTLSMNWLTLSKFWFRINNTGTLPELSHMLFVRHKLQLLRKQSM